MAEEKVTIAKAGKEKAQAAGNTKAGQQQQKRKKKNPPDRQQPAWLFPPDEENPILNPKPKSKEAVEKDTKDRLHSIKYLKHKAVGAPLRSPPPPLLLQLIGAFLTAYGFSSTSRMFTIERKGRKEIYQTDDEVGTQKFEKGMPGLVRIFNDWYAEWETTKREEGSSSSEAEAAEDSSSDEASSVSDGSVSDSSESSDSDDFDRKPGRKGKQKKIQPNGKPVKGNKKAASSSESSSDGDDPDNDESDNASPQPAPVTNGKKKLPSPSIPEVGAKAPEKKTKGKEIPVKTVKKEPSPAESSSDSESSDSSESDSSDAPSAPKPTSSSKAKKRPTAASSDATTKATKVKKEISPLPPAPTSNGKRKRSGSPKPEVPVKEAKVAKKANPSFTRVPADTKIDPKFASNAYVSNEYGERAHQDLLVTKGKRFTKEKNKKKRGS